MSPPIPTSLDAPPSIEQGRKWRARRKPKTLGWWLQTVLGTVWVCLAVRGLLTIPTLVQLDEPQAMQEVVTTSIVLAILSACLLILHFKTR
jgi:hypothetical protein